MPSFYFLSISNELQVVWNSSTAFRTPSGDEFVERNKLPKSLHLSARYWVYEFKYYALHRQWATLWVVCSMGMGYPKKTVMKRFVSSFFHYDRKFQTLLHAMQFNNLSWYYSFFRCSRIELTGLSSYFSCNKLTAWDPSTFCFNWPLNTI